MIHDNQATLYGSNYAEYAGWGAFIAWSYASAEAAPVLSSEADRQFVGEVQGQVGLGQIVDTSTGIQ